MQDAAVLRERAKVQLVRDEPLQKLLPVRVAIVESRPRPTARGSPNASTRCAARRATRCRGRRSSTRRAI